MVAGTLRSFVANFADLVSRGGTGSATFTRGAYAEPRRSGSGGWSWIAKGSGGERAVANPGHNQFPAHRLYATGS